MRGVLSNPSTSRPTSTITTFVVSVASLGGRTASGDTLQGGDTRREKFCGKIYKENGETRSDR